MRLADYSPSKRLELVALALNMVLQDLDEPASTRDVVNHVCRRLESDEREIVSRVLTGKIAPRIPEAVRSGETFKFRGIVMERWEWWPKGQTPSSATRAAKRKEVFHPVVWRGTVYASREQLAAAQLAAGEWEV